MIQKKRQKKNSCDLRCLRSSSLEVSIQIQYSSRMWCGDVVVVRGYKGISCRAKRAFSIPGIKTSIFGQTRAPGMIYPKFWHNFQQKHMNEYVLVIAV